MLALPLFALAGCDSAAAPDASAPAQMRPPSRLSLGGAPQQKPHTTVPKTPNGAALNELLANVPRQIPSSTNADGGSLVGRKSGAPGEVEPFMAAAPQPGTQLQIGTPTFEPLLSSPALERSARAQLYWALHKACPAPDGKPLPPDVITLRFTIRADGSIEPASVSTSCNDPQYQPVAECVLRTFSSLPFHGPTAGHGSTATLIVTWPSVD